MLCGSFVAFAANTTVHKLGYSAVDSGEIPYGSSTQYTEARDFGIDLWNDFSSKVIIVPDTIWSIEDLTFKDANKPSETWTGLYKNQAGADSITFNSYFFDKAERQPNWNNKTDAHEIGHSLGIDDHYEDYNGYSNLIMNGYASSVNTLGQHDKDDYNNIN